MLAQCNADINNIAGTISAGHELIATAGRDINVETTTRSASSSVGGNEFSRTTIDRVGSLVQPTVLLEQAPVRPSNELIGFIVANTGGSNSPYLMTPAKTYTYSSSLPAAPEGTTRVTMTVDGVAYFPLVAVCPAASCSNGDTIADAIPDAGTSAYNKAVQHKMEKDMNIASALLGAAGAVVRGVDAVTEMVTAPWSATRVAGATAEAAGTLDITASTSLFSKTSSLTAPSGQIVEIPANASMSNVTVREWYLSQEARIPELIDQTASLEEQAHQAWQLRNTFRDAARNAMLDQIASAELRATRPNLTWEQTVQKYSGQNPASDTWQQIIEASQRSNKAVNQSLGVKPTGKR